MKHIRYKEVSSTSVVMNEWLRSEAEQPLAHGTVLSAAFQGAGHGQMGNGWESEAGANATFSIALRALHWPAEEHFAITQAVSLALTDYLLVHDELFPQEARPWLKIKWPNDLYVQDGKLSGILIESRLSGRFIQDCICGVGLNVNQCVFLSDAPNPRSLRQVAGHCPATCLNAFPLNEAAMVQLIEGLAQDILNSIDNLCSGHLSRQQLQEQYLQRLYRYKSWHEYQDQDGRFEARIVDVLPDGRLQLEKKARGELKNYALKQVRFVI